MSGKPATIGLLKTFSPLGGLKAENLQALAKKTTVDRVSSGQILFREGDTDKKAIFLVSGEVELTGPSGASTVSGGTYDARFPLGPTLPRKCTARTISATEFIVIDSDLLDVMLTWDQTGSYEVSELRAGGQVAEQDDWMTTMLQTKALHKVPPANLQAIFMRMQQIRCKAGDVIIKQGDEGDYFYVVTEGRCAVTRETPLNQEGIKLAELEIGDTFGEEALISEAKRNATVTMLSDGSLMRLAKDDFRTLLNEPMLEWVSAEEARQIIEDGGQWLDVRLPSEFDNFHEEGAINIPLYFIRLKLKTLEKDVKYVVCCDTGRRSSAAAFILGERGFETYVLRGGLTMSELS